jgi:hypothetical protein
LVATSDETEDVRKRLSEIIVEKFGGLDFFLYIRAENLTLRTRR